MSPVRRAAVAGTWYPGSRPELEAAVDTHLAGADPGTVPQRPRALVVPHAGLMYSGPVGAFAYAAVRGARYRTVVLVGPSHFVGFRGVSIWPTGAWETPLGPLPVDEGLASAIAAASPIVVERASAHEREHSLEMQMPFLARLMPGIPIVPLVMGHQNRETAEELGRALAAAIAVHLPAGEAQWPPHDPAGVLLVASSDLSHYEDARRAAALDGVIVRHVERLDPDGLMRALEREPRHACGGGPMVAVLQAARHLGATRARVLQYADSGDVTGDKSSVVGYMAAVVW